MSPCLELGNLRILLPILLVALAAAQASGAASADPPNVLFIAIDDLNDWVEPLGGHPQARTPNLQRLAERGVTFTRAYTPAPSCNAARTAILTGIPPYRSGVYENDQAWRPALPDAITLPQYFMQHGYWTGGSGKIYHGTYPDPASWDEYHPSKTRQMFANPVPPKTPLNGLSGTSPSFDWGPLDVAASEMGDWKAAEWVAGQLRTRHERPFFMAFGVFRPHQPMYVPAEYFEGLPPVESIQLPEVDESDLDDVPAPGVRMARPERSYTRVLESGQWRNAVRAYLASIRFADAMVGKVLDALDAGPHAHDTIVVLWSDHGWHLGEKQHWGKYTLWEEGTRVPLLFVVPKGTPGLPAGAPPGARVDRPVSLIGLYATLVELAGLPPRPELPETSPSLVRLLRDRNSPWRLPVVTTHRRRNHSVRGARFRLIQYANGQRELYDHEVDPGERKNLAYDPAYRPTLALLRRHLPQENAPERPHQPRDSRTNLHP